MRLIIRRALSVGFRIVVVAAAVVTLFETGEAARLTVRVNNSGGASVSGATVCYNNSDNSINDTKTTSPQGEAVFDNVPQGALKIVASRDGFTGFERVINMGSADRTEIFVLQAGAGGPVCDAAPPPANNVVLTIQVSRQNGSALDGAVVCVSQNNVGNAKVTDSQGRAVFSGPAPPLPFTFRLLVQKQGFQHIDQQVSVNSPAFQQSVAMSEGSSTPPSNVNCALPLQNQGQTILTPISITNFKVNGGSLQTTTNRTVTLTASFSRVPGVYRVGETSNLTNRPWIPFNPNTPITYHLNLVDGRGINFGVRQVHFQVAPAPGNASLSNIAVNPVILAPAQISSRTLTGTQLLQFISQAQEAGYSFTFRRTDRRLFEGTQRISFSEGCTTPATVRELFADNFGNSRYVQYSEFKVFDGPPLNPFWKIQTIEVTPPTVSSISNEIGPGNATASITNSSGGLVQGLQQTPRLIYTIESSVKVRKGICAGVGSLEFQILLQRPSLTSITVEGPSNLDVLNALPPRN